MKMKVLLIVTMVTALILPNWSFGQVINLGTAQSFELFTSVGAISNTGISQVTGNVGSNSGSSTNFGNVNGVMHDGDGASGLCAADLTIAYNQLAAAVPTFFPAPLLGNGQVLNHGVYSISGPTVLNLGLTLDAQNDPNAVFIIQISGSFSANAYAHVILANGALACNVYWKIEGMVSLATGVSMKGTIVANNAAIDMGSGDTLEGRALSTAGAITINGVLAYTPIGCGSPHLIGPIAPVLGTAACYEIFSTIGPVTNAGVTHVIGDVGSDNGLTTGFNPLFVVGAIHGTPDGSTAQCGVDLLVAYNYLNVLPVDIELLYPVQFGNGLVLTPHTYRMNAACTLTDTVFMNAQGDPNAVFVIQINGALTSGVYSTVWLINGAQAKNIYWKVEGLVSINNYSLFNGTLISNNGAINLLQGATINGRTLTTNGAINVNAVTANMTPGCGAALPPAISMQPINVTVCIGDTARFIVQATGDGLTYQWRNGNVILVNGGHIHGATSDSLVIYPVSINDTSSFYNVIVSGTSGPNDTSNNARLVVNAPPVITLEPINDTVCIGGTASYRVASTGTGLTYQWRRGTVNLINGGNISGATNDTLTIFPVLSTDTSLLYNVIVSGICSKDTSVNAALVTNAAIIITVQPTNQIACTGGTVSFIVQSSGSGLTYQWRKGNINLINAGNISGVTNDTLTINPIGITDTSSFYNVIIMSACSPNDTSNSVSLTVNAATIITTQPTNQIACTASSAMFIIHATGTGLTYQWRKGNVNLNNGGNISGVNNDTLTINPVGIIDTSSFYNVIIMSACSPNDTSNSVSLTVNAATIIATQPINQIVCSGSSTMFIFQATGTGLTYQWRKGNVNLINAGNISGVTNDTLTINPVGITDTSSYYNVIIMSACSPNDTSNSVSLTVNDAPIITTEPVNQTVCTGNTVTFNIIATGNGLTYQWRKGNVNLVNGGNISGATSPTLTINPSTILDAAINYNVIISGTCAPNDTSNNVVLTVNPIPIAVASSNSPVCLGSSINLFAQTVAGGSYDWSGPNGFISIGQNPVIANSTIVNAGTYTLSIVANGCVSASTTTTVVLIDCSSDLSVFKTVDNEHPLVGTAVIFTIVATNNGPHDATGVSVTEILQSGYTYSSSSATMGNYNSTTGLWIIGIIANGISETLTVTVIVNPIGIYTNTAIITGNEVDGNPINNVSSVTTNPTDFFIPEGFSPNGDLINDLFHIRGLEYYPNNGITIYNRWGDKVFAANPYNNDWDGTTTMGLRVGGNLLPVGTYFYTFDFGNGNPIIKGTIYLNR